MGFVVFYITHPDESHARRISKELIDRKYIACSNIYPISSEYAWKGNIENQEEWVTLSKTSYDNIERIEQLVEQIHDYEVPCVSHWEASANVEYEKWIFKNVLR